MNGPQRFRKKPVAIEAMCWPGGAAEATPVIQWVLDGGGTARYHEAVNDSGTIGGHWYYNQRPEHLRINTLEGMIEASPGDWVIKGVKGEFYPCKPDIFAATYEAATDE